MDDRLFYQIVDVLGYSRRGYRRVRKGVKRRIAGHMAEMGCKTSSDYMAKLANSGEAIHRCRLLMTVPISRFFRDGSLWPRLQNTVLPYLTRRFGFPLSFWCGGCGGGEEVYSLKMVCEESAVVMGAPPLILATDIHPQQIARAELAVYPRSSIKEVPADLRKRWFRPAADGRCVTVRQSVRRGIDWQQLDIASDMTSASHFHLIFLRNNILTYYRDPLRGEVFGCASERLAPGGVLVVGARESPPGRGRGFTPWFPCVYIKDDARTTRTAF
jgi:chemotaxis methyl-accepting protein methylase